MLSLNLKKNTSKLTQQKYYRCGRCGYITIVDNSTCPICVKEGVNIKMV